MALVQCMKCKKELPCLCHLTERAGSRRSMSVPPMDIPPLDEGTLGRLWDAMQRVQRGEDEA